MVRRARRRRSPTSGRVASRQYELQIPTLAGRAENGRLSQETTKSNHILHIAETIDTADQHQGEQDEERQDFGDRVSLLLLKPCVPDNGMKLEGLLYIEYNRVDRNTGVYQTPF